MLGIDIIKRLGGGASGIDIRSATVSGLGYAAYKLDNDGFSYHKKNDAGNPFIQSLSWISPQIGMANFDVRATMVSGAVPTSGTIGSWENLGTDRVWVRDDSVSVGVSVIKLEIRLTATGTVVDSANITLAAKDIIEL